MAIFSSAGGKKQGLRGEEGGKKKEEEGEEEIWKGKRKGRRRGMNKEYLKGNKGTNYCVMT
jgi:hypothetical protein